MNLVLYYHGGSGNRGCEAIVRSTLEILKDYHFDSIKVLSTNPDEDFCVGLDKVVDIYNAKEKTPGDISLPLRGVAKLYNKIFNTEVLYYHFQSEYFHRYDFSQTIALSIGGDHYCYVGAEQGLAFHNSDVKKHGGISVLWGCSVEPDILSSKKTVEDMKRYDLITARESLTYDALKKIGVEKVILCPDPAFVLPVKSNSYSETIKNNTIGINASPYAMGENNIGFENYIQLIQFLLNNTDMNICLIPHVFKSHSNDNIINHKIYDRFKKNARISIIDEELSAEEIKAVIEKCRFFVGARTHSTIAAYSSCVPTLVVGYSVKAKGIAKDIFGSYENYVVSIQNVTENDELKNSFVWIYEHENEIREHLHRMMPEYIERARDAGKEIQKFFE